MSIAASFCAFLYGVLLVGLIAAELPRSVLGVAGFYCCHLIVKPVLSPLWLWLTIAASFSAVSSTWRC